MATNNQNEVGEETPIFTRRDNNIRRVNKWTRRIHKVTALFKNYYYFLQFKILLIVNKVITSFIRLYTFRIFQKKCNSGNKFCKFVLVMVKSLILITFSITECVCVFVIIPNLHYFDNCLHTISTNCNSSVPEVSNRYRLDFLNISTNVLQFLLSLFSLILLYFCLHKILDEFEPKFNYGFDISKLISLIIIASLIAVPITNTIQLYNCDLIVSNSITNALMVFLFIVYSFLLNTGPTVICWVVYSICAQLKYETLSEIDKAKEFRYSENVDSYQSNKSRVFRADSKRNTADFYKQS